MTLPDERRRAAKHINWFLNNIWNMEELRRVSRKDKAKLVRWLGRHYPADYQIDEMFDLYDREQSLKSIPTCECGSMMLLGFNNRYYCYECYVREYERDKNLSEMQTVQSQISRILHVLWSKVKRVCGRDS